MRYHSGHANNERAAAAPLKGPTPCWRSSPRIAGRIESAADLYDWDELVQEDRVHRLIYTDPAIFQAEMTNIFGAVWVYLGHESQIPKNDDYITV